MADRGERVRGLTRLRERDDERFLIDEHVRVAELARRLDRAAHSGDVFDHVARGQRRIPRRAARDQHDLTRCGDHGVGNAELRQSDDAGVGDAVTQRVAHRIRLLMNLLEQKVRVAILLRLLRLPIDGHNARLDRRAVQALDLRSCGCGGHDLALAQQRDTLRVGNQRCDVAADEHLAVAQTHHERCVEAAAHDAVRLLGGHHDQCVRAPDPIERCTHCGCQVAAKIILDEVGHDLGVRVTGERVAVRHELGTQLPIVLDDPVVDQVDVAGAVRVRVSVLHTGPPVRRPARVSDAQRAGWHALTRHLALELVHLVVVLDQGGLPVGIEDGDAR